MAEHGRIAKRPRGPYQLRARAVSMAETRRAITRAAIELHGTIGPAATTMSAVADRAGVTRATVYRHFAGDEALFAACSREWLAANPRPDLAEWALVADPVARVERALGDLYRYYRATNGMLGNLYRDLASLPASIAANLVSYPEVMLDALDRGWPRSSAGRLRKAAILHAVAFDTWRSLAGAGLTDLEAARLMTTFVATASSSAAPPNRQARRAEPHIKPTGSEAGRG